MHIFDNSRHRQERYDLYNVKKCPGICVMRRNYANFAEIMAYYLTIDQGNTCVKVDIWDGNSDKIVASRTFDTLQVSDLKMLCNGHKPSASIYCTVSERDRIIIESLTSLTPHAVEMSVDMPMPVRIAYTTPRTLGLDRVAAAIGAYSLCKANRDILVIDIGTAITYDIVSADGIYRGGNIAPGVDMRLRALNHFTARLPLVTIDDTTMYRNGVRTQSRHCVPEPSKESWAKYCTIAITPAPGHTSLSPAARRRLYCDIYLSNRLRTHTS